MIARTDRPQGQRRDRSYGVDRNLVDRALGNKMRQSVKIRRVGRFLLLGVFASLIQCAAGIVAHALPTATPTPAPVTITSPASGSTVSGVVTFTCANPGGTAYLYIDEKFVAYSTYSWDTTKFTNGSHYLLCNGYRNGSLVGSAAENVTVSNKAPTPTPTPSRTPTPTPTPSTPTPTPTVTPKPPTPTPTPSGTPTPTPKPPTPTPVPTATPTPSPSPVTITSPASGSIVSGVVTFACANPGGTAYLYIDEKFVAYSTYSWDTTKFTNGSHYLLCNGYRNGSLVGSAAENVTVSNTSTPTPTSTATPTPAPT